jgi:hypothetical protein
MAGGGVVLGRSGIASSLSWNRLRTFGTGSVQSWNDRVLFCDSGLRDPVGVEPETIIGGSFCEPGRRDFTALEELVRDVIVYRFAWLFEVELEDGSRMDIYRSRDTCLDLFVAEDGRTFDWAGRDRYREIDPFDALIEACVWGYRRRAIEDATSSP